MKRIITLILVTCMLLSVLNLPLTVYSDNNIRHEQMTKYSAEFNAVCQTELDIAPGEKTAEELYAQFPAEIKADNISLAESAELYVSYYPGTSIPTYTYFSGRSVLSTVVSSDGTTCSYIYSYNVDDHVDYAEYLIYNCGWSLYDSQTAPDSSYVMWFLVKDTTMIALVADFELYATIVMVPNNSTPAKPAPTEFTLRQTSLPLVVGETSILTPQIEPEDAETTISWSSSDTSVATVSSNGTVTALKKGTATIIARTSNNLTAGCRVDVVTPPAVSAHNAAFDLYDYIMDNGTTIASSGKTKIERKYTDYPFTYTTTIRDDSNPNYLFFNVEMDVETSSGTSIQHTSITYDMATHTAVNGRISASFNSLGVYDSGYAPFNIATATYNKYHNYNVSDSDLKNVLDLGTCLALDQIYQTLESIGFEMADLGFVCFPDGWIPVTGISMNKSSESLFMGDTTTLTANVLPAAASDRNVSWKTSNAGIATVENGVVTAKAPGTATITATTADGGKTTACTITVTAKPIDVESVSLDKTEAEIYEGQTLTLKATISPSNATNKNVVWTSDNTAVATVENGVVTAVSEGTANITVTTAEGGKTATCAVTVKRYIPEIKVASKSAGVGKTVDVDISINCNTGISLIGFTVNYDNSALTLKSISNGVIFSSADGNVANVPFSFIAYNGSENETESGTLVTLKFEIKKNCPLGDYDITITDIEMMNIEENAVEYTLQNGTITIRDFIPGDVTGDGTVNRQDLLRIAKYFAGWDVEIDTAASDVTGDGTVNRQDLLRLAKYFAGWDVTLGQ